MRTDLSLVETDDLLTELGTRFNAVIFAGVQFRTDVDDHVKTFYNGHTTANLGLSNVITSDLLHHIAEWRELAENSE